jgi:hypothetical protein
VQRQQTDRPLLQIAQACALIYSFNGDDFSDRENGELAKIGCLIGMTADQVYSGVAELLRRDLAQRRGRWRAILPHALANRLGATALQNIPFDRVEEHLINGGSERLTKSFARRLGYLDTSPEATAIAGGWLDPQGWIGTHIWNLSEFGKTIFQNVLPAAPEAGLRALESNLAAYDTAIPNYRALRPTSTTIVRMGPGAVHPMRDLASSFGNIRRGPDRGRRPRDPQVAFSALSFWNACHS